MSAYTVSQTPWLGEGPAGYSAAMQRRHEDLEAVMQRRDVRIALMIGSVAGQLFKTVAEAFGRARAWRRERATYAELMALDEHMLRDIGIRRGEIGEIAYVAARSPEELTAHDLVGRIGAANQDYPQKVA
jgi:uncharacterized protein YjiS (DUF1127 family)